ncbi:MULTISPECIES: YtzI protein [Metabacillus]|uniref:YtzI protein n=1 Tax=Metabacillus endolithicus TaxID=1535204 RepID=A0ABW5BTT4_9BACI|nr:MULTISPECIES: YtzI protein [Metabacillus]UHA62123.1 YtzI protein [Metabacillus litoralis]UPG64904.1 YtzI protein [Metabacillus endolithicus]
MKTVFIICIIIVIIVLLLSLLTTRKAYQYKHTVDPIKKPVNNQETQEKEQEKPTQNQ